jgi:hypothetical protein
MGEKEALAREAPAKDSLHGSYGQDTDSVRLIQLRKNGESGRRRSISARSKLPSMDLIHMLSVSSGA